MRSPRMLYDATGSYKFKIASFEPELTISQLVEKTGTKFQLKLSMFSRYSYLMTLPTISYDLI